MWTILLSFIPFIIRCTRFLFCFSYYVFLLFIFPFKLYIPVTYSIIHIMYSCYLLFLSDYVFLLLILSFKLCIPLTYSVLHVMYSCYLFSPSNDAFLLLILPSILCIGATFLSFELSPPALNPYKKIVVSSLFTPSIVTCFGFFKQATVSLSV